MKTTPRFALALGSSLAAVAVLAACGAGADTAKTAHGSGTAGSAAVKAGVPPVAAPALDSLARSTAVTGGATTDYSPGQVQRAPASAPAPGDLQQAVIRTGSITMTATNPDAARTGILSLVRTLRGTVANERSGSDAHGRIDQVDLTLRIPSANFDTALAGLRRFGTVLNLQQAAQDVTTQVIDVAARVKAQAASIDSIRQLLARATTIGQVMAIESELSSRQATLDSLERQQKYLADQTSLSTIVVSLTEPAHHRPKPVKHTGFIGGFDSGWHALGRSAVAVGSAVGAALPFAALALLVGVPLRALLRNRRRTVSAN